MAAITDAQTMAVFEILEVPQASGFTTNDEMGAISADTQYTPTATASAYIALTAAIAALVDPQLARVEEIADKWNNTVRLKLGRINDGQVGTLSNATADYDGLRSECRALLQIYLPFYKYHEVLAKRSGVSSTYGGGFNVPISR